MKKKPYVTKKGEVVDADFILNRYINKGILKLSSTGCWEFNKEKYHGRTPQGYITTKEGEVVINLKRYLWELENFPINRETTLGSTCGEPSCINPAHVKPIYSIRDRSHLPFEYKSVKLKPFEYNGECIDLKWLYKQGFIVVNRECWVVKENDVIIGKTKVDLRRYVYQLTKGYIRVYDNVVSDCGNPRCIKPSHQKKILGVYKDTRR